MADVKISELTEANLPLDGTEDLPIVEGGVTKRCSTQDIADLAAFKQVKVSLSAAQLATANTAALQLIAAPGVNKMINVLDIKYRYNFVTTAYTSNTSLQCFLGDSATIPLTSNTNFLGSAETVIVKPTITATSYNTADENVVNQNVNIYASGGNPSGGDCTVDVYICYQIITL